MAGPSGMDAPAPGAPSMLDDTFRAISALSQGDPIRAGSIIVCMAGEEFAALRRLARTLESLTATEMDARRRAALLAKVDETMPACTCPPGLARHLDGCTRRMMLGAGAPMRNGLLPVEDDGRSDR